MTTHRQIELHTEIRRIMKTLTADLQSNQWGHEQELRCEELRSLNRERNDALDIRADI